MSPPQGIELSRRFYLDIVRPWLAERFPRLRHAAALIGYGSELLGFDDAMSQDHNWGPRVQLYVSEADFAAGAVAVVAGFAEAAPATFHGAPVGFNNRTQPPPRHARAVGDARHGLEVCTLTGALDWIGGAEPADGLAWLGLAEQRLIALTAGAVFHDDDGELTALRRRLAWFPRDVWLYKLACQWRRIAEEQAFVGRAGMVGDDLGSRVIAARLARDVMRLAFLVERRYAPYPKWFGTAFRQLACAPALSPVLARALAADEWPAREAALADAYALVGETQLACATPGAVQPRIGPYHGRPFTVVNADEMMAGIRAEIRDPALGALPLIGSLDQVVDATPVVEAPDRARPAMAALLHDLEPAPFEEP